MHSLEEFELSFELRVTGLCFLSV